MNSDSSELEDLLLDIEGNLNKRPLTYKKDDIFHDPLTSDRMILERDTILIPVHDLTSEDDSKIWRK